VGKKLREDVEVLQAIRAVHPDCLFILDANEGYKPEEAIEVFEKLHGNYSVMLASAYQLTWYEEGIHGLYLNPSLTPPAHPSFQ